MDEVRLETERLILRMGRESDFDPYAEMCVDPEEMRHLGGEPMTKPEAWRNLAMVIGHWHLRGYGMWVVEERSSGEVVGRVGCWRPEEWPGFEVGWILRSQFWGHDFAMEAARASLDYAFGELGQSHVISVIHPDNRVSVRVAERLGEQLEGKTEVFGIEVLVYGIDRDARRAA